MEAENLIITSLQNPRVKDVVKLRKRADRDEVGMLLIEGYREVKRAADNHWPLSTLFICPPLFMGSNESSLVDQCRQVGAEIWTCSEAVFRKMAYRDRPDGLLALGAQVKRTLEQLQPPADPLLLVAESIEKPGNLGTMLRSADAAGVHGVIVCDRCTDINNPNVVRSSVGTLFTVPLVETSSREAVDWLRARGIRILAATPHATQDYTDVDLTKGTALVMGTEQYGLSSLWMNEADCRVRIPMQGQVDSLNVAAATTILLFEALRQRRMKRPSG